MQHRTNPVLFWYIETCMDVRDKSSRNWRKNMLLSC